MLVTLEFKDQFIMPNHMTRDNGLPEHSLWCNCPDCRTAWKDWLASLNIEPVELRQAKPATDAEWAAFMDAEWPRAKEGVSRG